MFTHIFTYKLKILLNNKAILFWALIFPFILATLFQFTLGNVGEAYNLKTIPIAVVEQDNSPETKAFNDTISELSKSGDTKLFNATFTSEEKAKQLLKDSKIDGYIFFDEASKPELMIKENGINQTIIKTVINEYYQMSGVATDIEALNTKHIYDSVFSLLKENTDYIKDNSTENIDFSINYFFTLIAMTCLYGSLLGLEVAKDNEANLTMRGARNCMAPTNKLKTLIASISAAYLLELITTALLFVYLIFVFGVKFGDQILPTVILAMVGTLSGVLLGVFVGSSNKKSEGFKTGVLIGVTMFLCFFSGMMGDPSMKSFFDETLPVFAYINPVNIITDGLYSLFAYDTLEVYYSCLARISVFAGLMMFLSFIFVRRKNYDSI